ncbi:hypothetical protein [Haladaptatus salinisoli]|uniref:hypothetical protein n=1 Tax=Haladaptatus salinisoli TaxID=2884876 RepID=UPI001D0B6DB7|nr:hypothetical protein [Haladaptatus salinisoli]
MKGSNVEERRPLAVERVTARSVNSYVSTVNRRTKMAAQREVLAVLLALEFVVVAAVVFLVVPFEAALPLAPMFLLLVFALYKYYF